MRFWHFSEGSGKTARMRRIASAFAGRICGKYHDLMSWHNNLKQLKVKHDKSIIFIR